MTTTVAETQNLHPKITFANSVVEQTKACVCHGHPVGVTCISDLLISIGTTRLSHILHTTLHSMVNGVSERKECIRRDGNTLQTCQKFLPLVCSQRCNT